jgi:hypothetical protein
MPNQKNPGRPSKQDKSPVEPARDPMRKPEEGGEDIERDRSNRRNDEREDRTVQSGVISNDEEVEVEVEEVEDLEDDEESNQITGRHPSQRDRDLK